MHRPILTLIALACLLHTGCGITRHMWESLPPKTVTTVQDHGPGRVLAGYADGDTWLLHVQLPASFNLDGDMRSDPDRPTNRMFAMVAPLRAWMPGTPVQVLQVHSVVTSPVVPFALDSPASIEVVAQYVSDLGPAKPCTLHGKVVASIPAPTTATPIPIADTDAVPCHTTWTGPNPERQHSDVVARVLATPITGLMDVCFYLSGAFLLAALGVDDEEDDCD